MFNEAERRCARLQREKDAERKKMAYMKKNLDDVEDEKAKLEEVMNSRLEETDNTRLESEKEELQTELNNLKKLKK